MEVIIVTVLFLALMACWVFLPGKTESAHAHAHAEPVAGAKATNAV